MAVQAVLNSINALFNDQLVRRFPVGTEIARLVFLMRAWSVKSLTLQGATPLITQLNINRWLDDFEIMFRNNMVNINTLAGFGGWAMARIPGGEITSKKLFLESYTSDMKRLLSKDLTQARVLKNGLALKWRKNWKEFYATYDQFIKEGNALGLTFKEINENFISSSLFESNVALESINRNPFTGQVTIRNWKPETYSQMYARTRSAEIQDEIMRDEMLELGLDIVRVSDHNTETPICRQFEGRYYSLTGETGGIPVLQIKPPFHPSCRHFLLPQSNDTSQRRMQTKNKNERKQTAKFNQDLTKGEKTTIKKQEAWNLAHRR